jgi:hypothetical protein
MQLNVQEPIRDSNREAEDHNSWKPDVPFMEGSVEDPGRETSHRTHVDCYLPGDRSSY